MELRQWIIAGAGVVGTTTLGIVLDRAGIPTWALVIVVIVCLSIVVLFTARSASHDWAKVDSRFKGLAKRDEAFRGQSAGELRAEHGRRANGSWCWCVDGGNADFRREAERICALAGQCLTRSRKVALSPRTQRVPDDLSRWLYFLIDIDEGKNDKDIRIDSAGTNSSPSGDVVTIYPYSIPNLVQASRNGCLECLRLERGGVNHNARASHGSS